MLKTAVCGVLGIDVPIILAPMAVFNSPARIVAAVSNHGGLGSVATLFRSPDAVKRDIEETKAATHKNFAVNHVVPMLDDVASATRSTPAPQ